MVEFIYDSNLEQLDEMGIPRNKVQKNLNKSVKPTPSLAIPPAESDMIFTEKRARTTALTCLTMTAGCLVPMKNIINIGLIK